jgi:hypothetical protein
MGVIGVNGGTFVFNDSGGRMPARSMRMAMLIDFPVTLCDELIS